MRKIITIDFDEVCNQSMAACIDGMKEVYGSDTTMTDCNTNIWYQVRGMGTPAQASRKLNVTAKKGYWLPKPVDGLLEALKKLNELGFECHIVTALPEEVGSTESSLEREAETNQKLLDYYQRIGKTNVSGLDKLEAVRKLGASVLIDDCPVFLLPINEGGYDDLRGILFGDYGWSKHAVDYAHPHANLTYEELQKVGFGAAHRPIEFGENLFRAKNWNEVVELLQKWENEEEGEL